MSCNNLTNICTNTTIVPNSSNNTQGIYFNILNKPLFNFNTIYGIIEYNSNPINTSTLVDKRIYFKQGQSYPTGPVDLTQGLQCSVNSIPGSNKYTFYYKDAKNFLNSNLQSNNYIYINLASANIGNPKNATIYLSYTPVDISGNVISSGPFNYTVSYNPPYTKITSDLPPSSLIWNQSLGSGLGFGCYALSTDSNGILYAGGESVMVNKGFYNCKLVKWNGVNWADCTTFSPNFLNPNDIPYIYAITTDTLNNVYIGGNFKTSGGITVNNIAKWNGTTVIALGTGLNGPCKCLMMINNILYVGGSFTQAGGVATNNIAKYDITSNTWSALGSGLNGIVNTFTKDSSNNLYAGGNFTKSGAISVSSIAKWNGNTWSALGAGLKTECYALTIDLNNNIYAGGKHFSYGEIGEANLVKWNGTTWSSLKDANNNRLDISSTCYALVTDSLGYIYAGGQFSTAGQITVNGIARWDGTSWSALGSGVSIDQYSSVKALKIDSSGNLYLGGSFKTAGGISVSNIAKLTELYKILPIQFKQTSVYDNFNILAKKTVQGNISNTPRYIKFSCSLDLSFDVPYYFSILLKLKNKDKTIATINLGNIQDKTIISKNFSTNLIPNTLSGIYNITSTPRDPITIILNNYYENYILYFNMSNISVTLKAQVNIYNDINSNVPFYTFTYGDLVNKIMNDSSITPIIIQTYGDMSNMRKITVTFNTTNSLQIKNIKLYGYNGNNLPDFNSSMACINFEKTTVNILNKVDNYSIELNCYSEQINAIATFKNLKIESYDVLTYLDNVQKITVENINNKTFDITNLKFYNTTYNLITPTPTLAITSGQSFYTLYFPIGTKLQKIVYGNPSQNDLTNVQINIYRFNNLYYELIGKTLPISQIQKNYTWIYPYFNLKSANDGCGVYTNNFTLAFKKNTTNLLYSYGGMIYKAVENIPTILTQIKGVCWSSVYNLFYCYGIRNGSHSGVIYSKDGINWQEQPEFANTNCIGMAINYYNDIIVAITDDKRIFYNNNGNAFNANSINTTDQNFALTDIKWGTKGFFISCIDVNNKNNNILYSYNGVKWYNNNNLNTISTLTSFSNIYSGYSTSNTNIIIAVSNNKLYYTKNYYNWQECSTQIPSTESFIKIVSGKMCFLLLTMTKNITTPNSQILGNNLYVSKDGNNWTTLPFSEISLLYYYNSNFYLFGKYTLNVNNVNIDAGTLPKTLYTSTDGITWKYISNYTPLPDIDNFYDMTVYIPKQPVNVRKNIDYITVNTTSNDPNLLKNLINVIVNNTIIYNEFNEIIVPTADFNLFKILCDSIKIYKLELNLPNGKDYNNIFLKFYGNIYNEDNTRVINSVLIGNTLSLQKNTNYNTNFRYSWVYPNYLLNYSTDGQIGSFYKIFISGQGLYCNYSGNGNYWTNCSPPDNSIIFTSICNGTVKIGDNLQNIYVASCIPGANSQTIYKNSNLVYSYDSINWSTVSIKNSQNISYNSQKTGKWKVICGYPVINNIITTVFIAIGYQDLQYISYDGINWKFLSIFLFDDIYWSGTNFYILCNNNSNSTKIYTISFSITSSTTNASLNLYYDMNNDKQNNSALKTFSKLYVYSGNIYLIELNTNLLYTIPENYLNPKLTAVVNPITLVNITTTTPTTTVLNRPTMQLQTNTVIKPIKLCNDIYKCYNILCVNILGINIFAANIPVIQGTKNNFIYTLDNGDTWNYSNIPMPSSLIPIDLIYNNNYIISIYAGYIAYSYDFKNWNIVSVPLGKINSINLINNNVGTNPVSKTGTLLSSYNYVNNLDAVQTPIDKYVNNSTPYRTQNGKYIKLVIEDVDINSNKQVLTNLSLCNDANSNIISDTIPKYTLNKTISSSDGYKVINSLNANETAYGIGFVLDTDSKIYLKQNSGNWLLSPPWTKITDQNLITRLNTLTISETISICKNLCTQFKPINETNEIINNIFTTNKNYDSNKLNEYFILNKPNLDISSTEKYDETANQITVNPYYNIINMPDCDLGNYNMLYTQKFLYNYQTTGNSDLDYTDISTIDKLNYSW